LCDQNSEGNEEKQMEEGVKEKIKRTRMMRIKKDTKKVKWKRENNNEEKEKAS
jgi:hypothetical protein